MEVEVGCARGCEREVFGDMWVAIGAGINVVYSVSAPVSVWPLEWNISVPVRFGVPFRVYRKYIYIYIYKISNYRQITSNNTKS